MSGIVDERDVAARRRHTPARRRCPTDGHVSKPLYNDGDEGKALGKFGELEAVVMDRLWTTVEPRSVREVLTDLQADREIAYTTVMTVMERLFRKGMLTRVERGKAFIYEPAMTRADYTADAMAAALAETGDRDAALVHFADKMTPGEASILLAALASRGERRPGRR